MKYLTDEKLAIFGSGGAIGSNMVQAVLTMGLTPNVAMYDPFDKGNEGAAEEIYHCAFPGARVTWTSDVREALDGASYLISSGGAPRKEGMTREDLLKGNAEIAAQLGQDIKAHCPDLKFGVIIFNPADITGLVTLVHSGSSAVGSRRWPPSTARGCRPRWPSTSTCRPGRRDRLPDLRRARRDDGRLRQHRQGLGHAADRTDRHARTDRRRLGGDQGPRAPGRQAHHPAARPQLVPEPVAPVGGDGQGRDRRQAVTSGRPAPTSIRRGARLRRRP